MIDDLHEVAPLEPDPRRPVRRIRLVLIVVALLLAGAIVALVGLLLALSRQAPASSPTRSDGRIAFVKSFPEPAKALHNPLGIAASKDRLYVAESDAGVVRVFSTDGRPVASLPLPRRSDGTTAYPSALTVLPDRLAVVDLAGKRVLLVSLGAKDYGKVTSLGSGGGRTAPRQPTAVAANGQRLLVADSQDHLVKEYDLDGRLVRVLARTEPRLTFVSGMIADGARLVVTDSNAGRVLSVPLDGSAPSVLPVRFRLPRGVATSPLGLAVADPFGKKAAVYASSGTEAALFPSPDGASWAPTGVVWLESERRFYVTDPATGRVLVFSARID